MAGNTIWKNSHMYTQMYVDKSNDHIICIYNIVGGYRESVNQICQNWNLPQIGGETEHIWNHQFINQEWVPQHCPGPIAPNHSGQVPALFTCKTSPTSPTHETHLTPMKLKDIFVAGMGNRLMTSASGNKKRGRDEHVMKDCVKSMCAYHLQSYEYSTCYAFIWDNYISVYFPSLKKTHFEEDPRFTISYMMQYTCFAYLWTTIYRASAMLFGAGNPIRVDILVWCCMFNCILIFKTLVFTIRIKTWTWPCSTPAKTSGFWSFNN